LGDPRKFVTVGNDDVNDKYHRCVEEVALVKETVFEYDL